MGPAEVLRRSSIAAAPHLKYRRQCMSVFETECHRIVHRLMHGTMLYGLLPIAMYNFAGKSFHYWPVRFVTKNPLPTVSQALTYIV